jgi:hypothetical protein
MNRFELAVGLADKSAEYLRDAHRWLGFTDPEKGE